MGALTIRQIASLAAYALALSACCQGAESPPNLHHEAHAKGVQNADHARQSLSYGERRIWRSPSIKSAAHFTSYHEEDPLTGRLAINWGKYFRAKLPSAPDEWFEDSDHRGRVHSNAGDPR